MVHAHAAAAAAAAARRPVAGTGRRCPSCYIRIHAGSCLGLRPGSWRPCPGTGPDQLISSDRSSAAGLPTLLALGAASTVPLPCLCYTAAGEQRACMHARPRTARHRANASTASRRGWGRSRLTRPPCARLAAAAVIGSREAPAATTTRMRAALIPAGCQQR